MEIRIQRTERPAAKPDEKGLSFGKYFTDHMFEMDYDSDHGWHDARLVPFGPLSLHPAATVFHYGAEVFEGLKAYRAANGEVRLFRPWENVARLNNSARRLCLPPLDPDEALQAITSLVSLDRDWVPHGEGTSLYLRPFLFGNDETLGIHTVKKAKFVVIASPVGSYYAGGLEPVRIMIEDQDVRAVRGGTGEAKCGGNYAASFRAGHKAEEIGFSQVLWLDGVERKYIEEVGAMNVMFLIDDTVVTPALTGSILPGITRKSCIQVLRDKGVKVEERRLSVDELGAACEQGRLREAFGCGTAAVVSPIGELRYKDQTYRIHDGKIGELTQMLYDTLTGIQWGKLPDPYGWILPIE